jgi:hypothetical protein
MIIKLPIIIDNKIYYSLFRLVKNNSIIKLSLMENHNTIENDIEYNILSQDKNLKNNISDYILETNKKKTKDNLIKILLCNNISGYELLNIYLPIEFEIIEDYIISEYFFIINIYSNLKYKLDFFNNLNDIINNKFNLSLLPISHYCILNKKIINYINNQYLIISTNKKFNKEFWTLINLILSSSCYLNWIKNVNILDDKSKILNHNIGLSDSSIKNSIESSVNSLSYKDQKNIMNRDFNLYDNELSSPTIKTEETNNNTIKKNKISKKILQITNLLKNINFSINYSNKYNIEEHIKYKYNNKLELKDIIKGNIYFLSLNNDKTIMIKVKNINNNILEVENSNHFIDFYKYTFYNYFPDIKITKEKIFYYFINSNEILQTIINKLDSTIGSIQIKNIINYFQSNQIISELSFFILENNENNLIKTHSEILKSNSYTNEYFKNICNIEDGLEKLNYITILELLFTNYSFPIKFNKKELDNVFDSILYISLLNINNILITNNADNKIYLNNNINIPNKLKLLYFNQLKIFYLLIKNNDNVVKYISDNIHFNIIKIILSSKSLTNEIIFKLVSHDKIIKFKNTLITNFMINDILSRLTWDNLNKKLNYVKILLLNKDYLLFFDKINKNLFPTNFDNRIKFILLKPYDMFKYLRKESDFIKWTNFIGDINNDFYNKSISFCTNDFDILGKIIYNFVNIKQQNMTDKYYSRIIMYGNKYPKLILDNTRINIKIKEFLNFIKCNINLGILAKHLFNNKENIIEFNDEDDEIIKLKNTIIILSNKYLKYKKKYINSINKL